MPMEEQEVVSRGFSLIDRSNSKIVGEKRRSSDVLEERHGFRHRNRHLDLILDSGTSRHGSKDIGNRDSSKQLKLSSKEVSEVAKVSQRLDKEALARRNENEMTDVEAKPSVRQLDLNTDVCLANDSESNFCEKQLFPGKQDNDCLVQRGFGLDLNADAVSSSVNDDDSSTCSSRRYGRHGKTKSGDVFSECGSSNVPVVGEKDPMKLWKAMKQNGFLSHPHGGISAASSCLVSSSHGGIPAPRKRGRKTQNDLMKRKIDIARKEQVDRFAKLAAPSGLLNNLNPGIINHVRNKKQVLSIIENLVKTEQDTINFHRSRMRSSVLAGVSRRNLGVVNCDGSGSHCSQAFKSFMSMDKYTERNNEQKHGDGNLSMFEAISEGLKIQASANVSENVSSLSAEESTDFSSASVLTVKAATVASQWLELLHQDIKGRLSALRRSKKRVRAVVTTELPFLIVKEFPSDQENDPAVLDGVSGTSKADMHKARWMSLFDQMDQTLSEEEKQLESWLNQVRELQLQCDQGLQHLSLSSGQNFLQLGMPEDSRSGDTLSSDRELAVRAAAASIYSTCNFLMSKENVTCT